jgi:hypothetical protein
MEIQNLFFLAIIGLLATAYKVYKAPSKMEARVIIAETILSILISLTIVPAIMVHYHFGIYKGMTITAIFNIFSSILLKNLEKKIKERTK